MRILIVEDELRLLRGLSRAFRVEGYAVDMADEGREGLFKAESQDYDGIVLDVMLPGIDGWEFLARLRQQKNTPVMMLSACGDLHDRLRGFDLGADDYLVKPFQFAELLARMRALIRRSRGQPQPWIELGEVAIDMRSRLAVVAGHPVTLTSREYSILEYLALHRGQVVSRTELYEHILDESDDSFSNLVDVHVSGIRRKLGHSLITTRRGHGYCIE